MATWPGLGNRGEPSRFLLRAQRWAAKVDAQAMIVLTRDQAELWRRSFPEAKVIEPVEPGEAMHALLAQRGPFDLIVDVAGVGVSERSKIAMGHVRVGGRLLAVDVDGELEALVNRFKRLRAASKTKMSGPVNRQLMAAQQLARSVGTSLDDGLLVAEPTVPAAAVVRDADIDGILELRGAGSTVATRAAQAPQVWPVAWSRPHPLHRPNDVPLKTAPTIGVREYLDATVVGRQAAVVEGLVLPESFRNPSKRRLNNVALAGLGRHFVVQPPRGEVALAGRYFLLDTYVPNHFGHAMTEQLGHLWGWHLARAQLPDLRGLLTAETADWVLELLAAAGVPRSQIDVVTGPVQVEGLVACSPAYVIGEYLHPVMLETWNHVGQALGTEQAAWDGGWPERVFLTRSGEKRAASNRSEVENFFRDQGFVIVAPEEHSLPVQCQLVQNATTIAGFAGSQMFTLALRPTPANVILITSDTYPAHNEVMMSQVRGHRLQVLVCEAQVARGEKFSVESFHSSYTVDLDGAGGRFLFDALA